MNNDLNSAKIILNYAPELLTEPDQNGLRPIHILLYMLLKHDDVTPSQKHLVLLALQSFAPVITGGCSTYCPNPIDYYIPAALPHILRNTECSLANTHQLLLLLSNVAHLLPWYVSFPAKILRVSMVAHYSLSKVRQAWNYASYAPLTAFKQSVVHMGIAGLSVGREIMNGWD